MSYQNTIQRIRNLEKYTGYENSNGILVPTLSDRIDTNISEIENIKNKQNATDTSISEIQKEIQNIKDNP